MSRAKKRTRRQRSLAQALGAFRQPDLAGEVVRFELRNALPAKQRVFVASGRNKKFSGLVVLFNRLVGAVLTLLEESIPRHSLGSLLRRNGAEEPVVDGQRLAFVLRIDQQIKQHAVIHGGAVRLINARVQIA